MADPRRVPMPTRSLRYWQPEDGRPEELGFRCGVAYAVSCLIRQDAMTLAREIWDTTDRSLSGVPTYDAKPIKHAIATDWSERYEEDYRG